MIGLGQIAGTANLPYGAALVDVCVFDGWAIRASPNSGEFGYGCLAARLLVTFFQAAHVGIGESEVVFQILANSATGVGRLVVCWGACWFRGGGWLLGERCQELAEVGHGGWLGQLGEGGRHLLPGNILADATDFVAFEIESVAVAAECFLHVLLYRVEDPSAEFCPGAADAAAESVVGLVDAEEAQDVLWSLHLCHRSNWREDHGRSTG